MFAHKLADSLNMRLNIKTGLSAAAVTEAIAFSHLKQFMIVLALACIAPNDDLTCSISSAAFLRAIRIKLAAAATKLCSFSKAANTETNALTHALQSAFKHVLKVPEKNGDFNTRGRIVVYQHIFFHQNRKAFSWSQSFPFLRNHIPAMQRRNRLYLRAWAR
jgi:hypothetical protein